MAATKEVNKELATYTALDVKRLREETDAPMMECKGALEEADGDYEKAKIVLREKGKAAAAKRADRSTAAGVVAIATSPDSKTVGAVVLECETDFVARNEQFVAAAKELAEAFLQNDPGSDPNAVSYNGKTVADRAQELVALFRENTKVTRAIHKTTDGVFATYVHHDNMKGAIVEVSGDADKAATAGRTVAIQSVAFPPTFVNRSEISQEKIDAELATETQRAINEGKSEEIAKNIAQGRLNKEWFSQVVLLDQPLYSDPSKTVGTFLKENGGVTVKSFDVVRVGQGE